MNKIPKRQGTSFQCQICKGVFDYRPDHEWSEQDAIEEFKRKYPEDQNHDCGVLCDDCYVQVEKWISTLSPEQKRKMKEDYEREIIKGSYHEES